MDQEHTTSVSRRTVRLALAFAVVMAVLAPAAVFAVGGTFVDDDTSIFEEDIEWLVANGVTAGCGTDTYCPEDDVTRGQMAAFMRRLATNKVVDAATAVTADSAATADSATTADTAANATNAGQLDGWNSTDFASGVIEYDYSGDSVTLGNFAGEVVASVSVEVPRRCPLLQTETVQVMVIGSGYFNGTTGASNPEARLGVDTVEDNNTFVGVNVDGGDTRTPYMTQWVFPVDPGTHTFELNNYNNGSSNVLSWWPRLSAHVLGSTCNAIVVLPAEPGAVGDGPDGK